MTAKVDKIAEQVKALPEKEHDEFLSWLACLDPRAVSLYDEEYSDTRH